MTIRILTFVVLLLTGPATANATDAPGAPGGGSAWTTGAKQGLGTSTTVASKIWYTIAQGVLTEVYYPKVDVPNVQDLQLIVTDGSTFVDLERDATNHTVQLLDPQALTYRQVNDARSGKYRITRTLVTDPDRPVLLMETRFQALSGGPYQVYTLYNPSLNNSGKGDTAATSGDALVASDGPVSSALLCSSGFTAMSNGYSGTSSDGLVDLKQHNHLTGIFDAAPVPGNVVQIGQVSVGNDTTFTLALGFSGSTADAVSSAKATLAAGFGTVRQKYESGWHDYLASLKPAPASITNNGFSTQYNVALMTLKAHEDKTLRGANIASLTIPWGQAVNADSCCAAGYHAVWARDLYEVATALISAGDADAAGRSLDYLLTVQQRQDGSFPQNTLLDGTPVFGSLQMDEVSYPIVLAWQLNRADASTWAKLKRSADFLVNRGPGTPEERWEENGGFSPSTIAAEIAGLVCAADIAGKNGDTTSQARYLQTADNWQHNVKGWTVTTSGPIGNHNYFIRIDNNLDPNDGAQFTIGNGGGTHDEREIVDAGFLELARLGVLPPSDPAIAGSIAAVESTIGVATPNGTMFYRYNHDGYGEKDSGEPYTGAGVGRLWPIFNGERGEYELLSGHPDKALAQLAIMAKAANSGFLIPEQVWDRADGKGKFTFGQGTDSATPLAWSMAQFVRLANSIDAGRPVELPAVVATRYGSVSPVPLTFNVTVPSNTAGTSKSVFFAGELSKLSPPQSQWDPGGLKMNPVDSRHWTITVNAIPGTTIQYKYVLGDWAFVEKDQGCGEIQNRAATLSSSAQVVTDTVAMWRNVSPCGN